MVKYSELHDPGYYRSKDHPVTIGGHIGLTRTRTEHGIPASNRNTGQYAKGVIARKTDAPDLVRVMAGAGIAPLYVKEGLQKSFS